MLTPVHSVVPLDRALGQPKMLFIGEIPVAHLKTYISHALSALRTHMMQYTPLKHCCTSVHKCAAVLDRSWEHLSGRDIAHQFIRGRECVLQLVFFSQSMLFNLDMHSSIRFAVMITTSWLHTTEPVHLANVLLFF